MDWLGDHVAAAWLIAALALAALELASVNLIFIMLAAGAVVGCVAAVVGLPGALQAALALAASLALLGVIRPNMVKKLHAGPTLRIGADALIGKRATVIRELAHNVPGRVKIGGEEWTAQPYDEDDRIEPGEIVDVVQIKGATAYVLRVNRLEP
ncbi:MAG: hypothetical protein JWR35_3020 [Marmoricola sp.]|jgi:membrane protein implicated in regulation of membrane protease activity|nr:hypothetical protein [Marmoricola sp.]